MAGNSNRSRRRFGRLRNADAKVSAQPTPRVVPPPVGGTTRRASDELNLDLIDAVARAEAAEAKVAKLSQELAHKEQILTDARQALRTARLALQEHLRLTDG